MPPKQLSFFARRPPPPSSSGVATSDPFEPLPLSSQLPPPPPAAQQPKRVLAVEIPASTLRPIAFRVFTKKHSLTLKSEALSLLCSFIGRRCGAEWRDSGSGEKMLDEIARQWKRNEGTGKILVDGGDALKSILKNMEVGTGGGGDKKGLQRVNSVDLKRGEMIPSSALMGGDGDGDVEMEDEQQRPVITDLVDPREYLKIVDAFEQPRHIFNGTKKQFEKLGKPSLLASPSSRTAIFRHRYSTLHSRLLRNDSFFQPTFSKSTSSKTTYKLTPISTLLGRAGQSFLLFGQLSISPSGALSLYDPTGEITLDLSLCSPSPSIFLCPGMFLLVEGVYEETGVFSALSMISPPPERRATTAEVYGHLDLLGSNIPLDFSASGGGASGRAMRKVERSLAATSVLVLGEVLLDQPHSLSAIRHVLTNTPIPPLALILTGAFTSVPVSAASSSEPTRAYKEAFDALADCLADFPDICEQTIVVLCPADEDPWSSAAHGGASAPWPRQSVPQAFLTRLNRTVKTLHAVSNPFRFQLFTSEWVVCREDFHSRFHRSEIKLPKPSEGDGAGGGGPDKVDHDTLVARRITKTVLDQGWLAPVGTRPSLAEFAPGPLGLWPLPSVVVMVDVDAEAWALVYEGCAVVNPGGLVDRMKRKCCWAEVCIGTGRGAIKRGVL